jgi:hypothetical protein
MADEVPRKLALERIRENVARSGHHIYVVAGGTVPRFAYTIGVSESVGFELILAGAIFYMKDELVRIINDIVRQVKMQRADKVFEVAELGTFTLREVHNSWAVEIILGALDYYQRRDIPTLQIVPDKDHCTIDVPDMRSSWSATLEPMWKWLREPWTFPVPENATATTNLAALRGDRITEVVRWEENEWEMFAGAGPNVPQDELRVVPLGTLIAADETLFPILHLAVDSGLWRDGNSEWHIWQDKVSNH